VIGELAAMATIADPAVYDAWYDTPRGRWIGECEFDLLLHLLQPAPGASLLDVGCGTGYFSRRFAAAGLRVTGIDPDRAAIGFAQEQHPGSVSYLTGSANDLPFPDQAFDHGAAITSLCFIADPARAVRELWRVSRRGVVLGLLNRRSLLYRAKHGRGGYAGARWDTAADVRRWTAGLEPEPRITTRYGIFLPGGGRLARVMERMMPHRLPWGSFLAVAVFRLARHGS
jgi:SAM-dependent methyltransferase